MGGRNRAPLTDHAVRRAVDTFRKFNDQVNARYGVDGSTVFRVDYDESGSQFGEIVFGPDLYPGTGVANPNSVLSMEAAVAHELTHHRRWLDMLAIDDSTLEHLDEALTSLQAVLYFQQHLNQNDVRQLVSDAMGRLQLFIDEVLPTLRAETAEPETEGPPVEPGT